MSFTDPFIRLPLQPVSHVGAMKVLFLLCFFINYYPIWEDVAGPYSGPVSGYINYYQIIPRMVWVAGKSQPANQCFNYIFPGRSNQPDRSALSFCFKYHPSLGSGRRRSSDWLRCLSKHLSFCSGDVFRESNQRRTGVNLYR